MAINSPLSLGFKLFLGLRLRFLLGTYLVCVAPRILWNLKERNETPAQPSCSSQNRQQPCIPHGSWTQESSRRGRQLGFGSTAKLGPSPVSPATRGPHAISDVQGSQKRSLSRGSSGPGPQPQPGLSWEEPELDLAWRAMPTRHPAKARG